MKRTSYLLVPFVLVLSLFSTLVSAQDKLLVTPDNYEALAGEIATKYDDLINVSAADIEVFFNDHFLTGDTNSACEHPNVSVSVPNNSTILFDWEDIDGAEYTVSTLRLFDGSTETHSSLTESYFEQEGPTKGLYLISFQSKCGSYRSDLETIIIDKTVMYGGGPLLKDCDCKGKTYIWQGGEVNGPDLFYPWSSQEEFEGYVFEFSFDNDANTTARFPAIIRFENNIPVLLYLSPYCNDQISISDSRTSIYITSEGGNELALLSFGFSEGDETGFAFESSTNVNGSVSIKRCDRTEGTKKNENTPKDIQNLKSISVESHPNPFYSTTTISYTLPKDQNISISIFNNYGQEVKHVLDQAFTKKGLHQLEVDLSDFPAGIYHCMIKTDSELKALKLLRIE